MSKRKPGWWMESDRFLTTVFGLFWAVLVALYVVGAIVEHSPAYLAGAAALAAIGGVWLWSILTWDRRMAAWKAAHGDD